MMQHPALLDIRIKLAVMVVTTINNGKQIRFYSEQESMTALLDEMIVIECRRFDIPFPKLLYTSMTEIDLDYHLSLERLNK